MVSFLDLESPVIILGHVKLVGLFIHKDQGC
jgi:hypothetical protein